MNTDEYAEFRKHLEWARSKGDHMAFAFALEEAQDNERALREFEDFRKDPRYLVLLDKALKRFRQLIQDSHRPGGSQGYLDDDYIMENKRRLVLLEAEAKKLSEEG